MTITYRLKDRALQEKLDELTDGDFSKGLAETMNEDQSSLPHISVDCGKWINPQAHERFALFRFRIFLGKDEIEAIPVYDPKAWNEYPAVEPPEGVWMRLEVEFCGKKYGHKARFSSGSWRDDWNVFAWEKPLQRTVRFRPWDDDEEKDE